MKIKKIISQHRRDFTAIFECEHCHNSKRIIGYDDSNFHQNVIPKMECDNCGKKSKDDYEPMTTKYPEGYQI